MTPLQIEILFWYHCRTNDFRDGDYSAPAVREAINHFRDKVGMIEETPPAERSNFERLYRLTDRGHAFVDHVCGLPLPVQRWAMPPHPSPESLGG